MNSITFYKTVPLRIIRKGLHIFKIGGRPRFGFHKDYGDIPGVVFENDRFIEVQNTRGNGYAGRNRLMYRKTKRQLLSLLKD